MTTRNTNDSAQTSSKKSKPSQNRRKARELVVKAIYRSMLNAGEAKQIALDAQEDPDYIKTDQAYFKQLFEGVSAQVEKLDQEIALFIDRSIKELSPVEHAILRVSTYELFFDVSIPYRVAINEGVELAKIYGGIDGHKYINGVLDKLAAVARPLEFRK
ncbi:MAG TPA: transcription antitermination factor NusB [Methylophilaceae bacterium]|nr:transcription antitermination factor NusB [Methylophilaceae bacterium]HAJ70556.1 transcription antitermination factor NusB [Methylophilaceae bacterium]